MQKVAHRMREKAIILIDGGGLERWCSKEHFRTRTRYIVHSQHTGTSSRTSYYVSMYVVLVVLPCTSTMYRVSLWYSRK